MTNESKKRRGTLGCVMDTIVAWENAMDYTPYDYVLDRVCNLERRFAVRVRTESVTQLNNAGGRDKPASRSSAVAR